MAAIDEATERLAQMVDGQDEFAKNTVVMTVDDLRALLAEIERQAAEIEAANRNAGELLDQIEALRNRAGIAEMCHADLSKYIDDAIRQRDAARARVAELEGKRRVRAFAAQYQGEPIAPGRIWSAEAQARSLIGDGEGWRVVPVEIVWEDGDADE